MEAQNAIISPCPNWPALIRRPPSRRMAAGRTDHAANFGILKRRGLRFPAESTDGKIHRSRASCHSAEQQKPGPTQPEAAVEEVAAAGENKNTGQDFNTQACIAEVLVQRIIGGLLHPDGAGPGDQPGLATFSGCGWAEGAPGVPSRSLALGGSLVSISLAASAILELPVKIAPI